MNLRALVAGILLVLLLIGTATAATLAGNISDDAYFSRVWNDTFTNHRNAANDHITVQNTPTTQLYALCTANTTTPYIADYRVSVITLDTRSLSSDATVTAGTITGYVSSRSGSLGNMNLTLIDISPISGTGTIVSTDFNRTTFTQVSDELPYSAFATPNATVTWTLNANGTARINKGGYTSFAIVSNWTVQNLTNTPTWSSGAESRLSIRSMTYGSGVFTPNFSITYTSGTATLTTNINHDYYVSNSTMDTFQNLRNGVGLSLTDPAPTQIYAIVASNATSPYISDYRMGIISIPTDSMGAGAVVTAGTITGYASSSSAHTGYLGHPSAVWVDVSPVNGGGTGNLNDYNRTGFVKVTDEIPWSAFATPNASVTWTLNNDGLARVNVTGNTTFMLVTNWTADNVAGVPSWTPSQESRVSIRSMAYGGGVYTPSASFTYSSGGTPSTIKTYPIPIINSTKNVLPNSNTNLPAEGYTLSVIAAPNQFEPASFIIKSGSTLTNIALTSTALSDADGTGHTAIPISAVDLKTVKYWYQTNYYNDPHMWFGSTKYTLVPELLLNDDNLVNVSYATQQQTMRLSFANGTTLYFPIDNRTIGSFPSNAYIHDNKTISGFPQLFNLTANENKQVWVTVHVPVGQAAGNYTGTVSVSSDGTTPVAVSLSVRVINVTLPTPALTYGWWNWYEPTDSPSYGSWFVANGGTVPREVYNASLQNLKNHGILYPTEYTQGTIGTSGYARLENDLAVRQEMGFPTDKIYLWASPVYSYISSSTSTGHTTPTDMDELTIKLDQLKNLTNTYGYGDLYVYGHDEPNATELAWDLPIMQTVSESNNKLFYAVNWDGRGVPYASLTGAAVIDQQGTATAYNTTLHNLYAASNPNTKLLVYDWPQGGVEDFDVYRERLGYMLYTSGYDGTMDFGYQHQYGQSAWNDYDSASSQFRDHNMIYPKSDGVIDTVQWEAVRQAVDDVRYADALVNYTGSNTSLISLINSGLAAGVDPAVIRSNIINQILPLVETEGEPPVSHFYMNITEAISALTYGAGTTYNGYTIGGGSGYPTYGGGHDANPLVGTYMGTTVTTEAQLVTALSGASTGDVVFIQNGVTIDRTSDASLTIPAGVTLASDRGSSGHKGALIRKTRPSVQGSWSSGTAQEGLLVIGGNDVRITGLQIEGEGYAQDTWGTYPTTCSPSAGSCLNEQSFMIGILNENRGIAGHAGYNNLTIDNNEMSGWAYAAIFTNGIATAGRPNIHHNYIHDNNNRGEGYGVNVRGGDAFIAGNLFDYNRHSVTGEGLVGEKYTVEYNIFGGHGAGVGMVDIDVHENEDVGGFAGSEYHITNNTVSSAGVNGFAQIREVPAVGFYLSQNDINSDGGSNSGFPTPIVQFATSVTTMTKVYATNNRWAYSSTSTCPSHVCTANTGITHFYYAEG